MKRNLVIASILTLLAASSALAQGRQGPPAATNQQQAMSAQCDRQGFGPSGSAYRAGLRVQLRDPANCPREDRPGCGDPQEVRQHQWCGREPGSPAPGWCNGGRRGGCGMGWGAGLNRGRGRLGRCVR